MVYEGHDVLKYVKNYVNGADQWGGYGFPITCRAPKNTILLGAKGSSSSSAIATLAHAVVKENYRGIMVRFASVKNGFDYAQGWDASTSDDSISGYVNAMNMFRQVTRDQGPALRKPVVKFSFPEPGEDFRTNSMKKRQRHWRRRKPGQGKREAPMKEENHIIIKSMIEM